MKRRRLHGLGDSPEGHKRKRDVLEREAINVLEDTAKNAARGHCKMALDYLMHGEHVRGMAVAHAQESHGYSKHATIDRLSREASAAYRKHCLPASLGAAPRRRRHK